MSRQHEISVKPCKVCSVAISIDIEDDLCNRCRVQIKLMREVMKRG